MKNTRFTPGEIWPDSNGTHINAHGGGILRHAGHYYWFGEHKIEGTAGNQAQVGVHCYSSTDLYNWKDEGIALAVSENPASEIAKGSIIERPKVIYNPDTKKFVMWFHLEFKGMDYATARSGVAISDQITGPYHYLGSMRANSGIPAENAPKTLEALSEFYFRDLPRGQMARDMTLFVDDDGTAYHIYASEENTTLQIAELRPDYTGHSGRYARVFAGQSNEAPALFKWHGKYYMISSGCSGWKPNAARSAVADSIWGPWRELGNPCRGTEHQKETTFDSQSTYVLPLPGNDDAFVFIADRWTPENAIDARHIWLPIQWEEEAPVLRWLDSWDLSFFPSCPK